MTLALRACLFASAAAGLSACASNPPLQPASIVYRGDSPYGPAARQPAQPLVMSDGPQPGAPPVNAAAVPSIAAPSPSVPPYQLVADLGPSSGLSAADEAKGMDPEAGARPGGARRVPRDNPAARAVEVQPRDTLYDISRRYNVNMRALIETNRLEPPYRLDVGAVVYLPPPNVHEVQKGETLYSVSRRYNVDTRSLALLNGMARPWTIWPGDELLLPPLARDQSREPTRSISAAPLPPVVQPAPIQQAANPPPPSRKPADPGALASPAPVAPNGPISLTSNPASSPAPSPVSPPAKAAPVPEKPPQAAPTPPKPQIAQPTTPHSPAGSQEFIWPVSGQVLKSFGPAANGQRNDGVNIAVSKGAEVRAAAGGEVVYAGSELAGFGNLVLIRHPGGWVTAYAHADTILVSEGDLVRQGQTVATAGSTGNAASPQVHFELRKGKEPVDPTRHLPPLQG